jgi:hypothetical protein
MCTDRKPVDLLVGRLPACGDQQAGGSSVHEMDCDFCGRHEPEERALTWTVSVEGGTRRTYCPDCSREHLRSIEGKLDPAWW